MRGLFATEQTGVLTTTGNLRLADFVATEKLRSRRAEAATERIAARILWQATADIAIEDGAYRRPHPSHVYLFKACGCAEGVIRAAAA
jgi:hypothetical protein